MIDQLPHRFVSYRRSTRVVREGTTFQSYRYQGQEVSFWYRSIPASFSVPFCLSPTYQAPVSLEALRPKPAD